MDEIDEIIEAIGSYSTVLFLGPLFGVDNNNKKICDQIGEYFRNNGPLVDTDFQNLFICKKEFDNKQKQYSPLLMANKMKAAYNMIKPGDVYEQIAKLNFSAMVCFTQDTFLVKAFEKNNIPHCFDYYSVKGHDPESLAPNELPVIYNVYGKYDNANSLILDYESFYDFLFSILGNNNFFSTNLSNRLSDADVLLFLGFDLKKWYVPVLVTKIYNSIPPSKKQRLMQIAAFNDTDQENEAYLQWLGKYPLNLSLIPQSDVLIDKLSKTPACLRAIRESSSSNNEEKNKWIEELGNIASVDELLELYNDIIDYANELKLTELRNFFTKEKQLIISAQKDVLSEEISYEQFRIEWKRSLARSITYLSNL